MTHSPGMCPDARMRCAPSDSSGAVAGVDWRRRHAVHDAPGGCPGSNTKLRRHCVDAARRIPGGGGEAARRGRLAARLTLTLTRTFAQIESRSLTFPEHVDA